MLQLLHRKGVGTMKNVGKFVVILSAIFILYGCNSTKKESSESKASSVTQTKEKKSHAVVTTNSSERSEETTATAQAMISSSEATSSNVATGPSQADMDALKASLRKYIFVEYQQSSNYVYADGINWTENTYDNLSAETIWNLIATLKAEKGADVSNFEQAQYLSAHAPNPANWQALFEENWNNDGQDNDFSIDKLIDLGNTVAVYTKANPYTGGTNNYPTVTVLKRTGYWHG